MDGSRTLDLDQLRRAIQRTLCLTEDTGQAMGDPLWTLVQECWAEHPSDQVRRDTSRLVVIFHKAGDDLSLISNIDSSIEFPTAIITPIPHGLALLLKLIQSPICSGVDKGELESGRGVPGFAPQIRINLLFRIPMRAHVCYNTSPY